MLPPEPRPRGQMRERKFETMTTAKNVMKMIKDGGFEKIGLITERKAEK